MTSLTIFCALHFLCDLASASSMKSFGVTVADVTNAQSTEFIEISLWTNGEVYRCSYNGMERNTEYICTSDEWVVTRGACDFGNNEFKLLVEDAYPDAVFIDSVFMYDGDIKYTIEAWCISDEYSSASMTSYCPDTCDTGYSAWDISAFDSDQMFTTKAVFDFDLDGPVHSYNAIVDDASNLCIVPDACTCTNPPSSAPTYDPTISPTPPSSAPTYAPTAAPSHAPSTAPSPPTNSPTLAPSLAPSMAPSVAPTFPTISPTLAPSYSPTNAPSNAPTVPTSEPTTSAPTTTGMICNFLLMRIENITFPTTKHCRYHSDPIMGNYYVSDILMNWSEGNNYCYNIYGTSLATIRSDEDAQTLLTLAQSADHWIGLFDYTGDNNGWGWASGYPWFVEAHSFTFCVQIISSRGLCGGVISDDDNCKTLKYWSSPNPSGSSQDCGQAGWVHTAIDNFVDDAGCSENKRIVCDIEKGTYSQTDYHLKIR